MIYNIAAIAQKFNDKGFYTYTRIKNLMMGMRGHSKKKDVQELRKILREEWQSTDAQLSKLEKEAG